MLFFSIIRANIEFGAEIFIRRTNIATKTLPTTKWVELIDKSKFMKMVLDKYYETFVEYEVILLISELAGIMIHLFGAT